MKEQTTLKEWRDLANLPVDITQKGKVVSFQEQVGKVLDKEPIQGAGWRCVDETLLEGKFCPKINMRSCSYIHFDFNMASIDGSSFNACTFYVVKMDNGSATKVRFDNSNMHYIDFSRCDLNGSSFRGCQMNFASFIGANLDNVSFDGAKFQKGILCVGAYLGSNKNVLPENAIITAADLKLALQSGLYSNSECEFIKAHIESQYKFLVNHADLLSYPITPSDCGQLEMCLNVLSEYLSNRLADKQNKRPKH